jgi:hypothetical protein
LPATARDVKKIPAGGPRFVEFGDDTVMLGGLSQPTDAAEIAACSWSFSESKNPGIVCRTSYDALR